MQFAERCFSGFPCQKILRSLHGSLWRPTPGIYIDSNTINFMAISIFNINMFTCKRQLEAYALSTGRLPAGCGNANQPEPH